MDLEKLSKEELVKMLAKQNLSAQKVDVKKESPGMNITHKECIHQPLRSQEKCKDTHLNEYGFCKKHSRTLQAKKLIDSLKNEQLEHVPDVEQEEEKVVPEPIINKKIAPEPIVKETPIKTQNVKGTPQNVKELPRSIIKDEQDDEEEDEDNNGTDDEEENTPITTKNKKSSLFSNKKGKSPHPGASSTKPRLVQRLKLLNV